MGRRDDPEEFCRMCRRRSLFGIAFSVIRERFGAIARAKTFAMRKSRLVHKCICCNLAA